MQNNNENKFPLHILASVAGVVLALGVGSAWLSKSTIKPKTLEGIIEKNPVTEVPLKTTIPEKPEVTEHKEKVSICWLDPTGSQIKLITKTLVFPKSVEKHTVLENAFKQLLTGPSDTAEYTTSIPQGTKLLDVATTEKGVKVNLSQEFITGGGSTSMSTRLAQVIYTASSLNSQTPVWISVDGKPLTALGGEGIMVSQPMTRQEFEANFSL